jgi:hypothetical protein
MKDPDHATFRAIADSLKLDIQTLETLWRQADNEIALSRIDWLIQRKRFSILEKGLMEWKEKESGILEAAGLIAAYQYPELSFEEIDDAVAAIVKDVWIELHDDMTPQEQIEIINRVLFGKYGMRGDMRLFPDYNNLHINNVLHFRKGCHIGLAILYISIAQKLGLPIFSVPALRIFSLAYTNEMPLGENVVFYIEPFNNGKIFDVEDAVNYFEYDEEMPDDGEIIHPCSDKVTILFLITVLMELFEADGMIDKAKDMGKLKQIFLSKKNL